MRSTLNWAAGGAALALGVVLTFAGWRWLAAEPAHAAVAAAAAAASSSHLALPSPPEPPASSSPQPAPRPAPPLQTGEWVRGIGSEGFGPHVQRALDSGDPRQALDAARWIASCRPDRDVESMINGTHPKYRLVLPPDARAEIITKERKNQRFCQTLTPDLMAQHNVLVSRALDAKVPGSGLAYCDSLDLETRNPAELELALRGLRADAENGEA